ncbi:hypothetical protein, partial [Pseudoduganella sp. RAF53_2]|uniref:hypothetical protein n=1 Tax=Pseudoduganella sp. RAF53_2 TaxID=3233060 RepID=UPI003F98F880
MKLRPVTWAVLVALSFAAHGAWAEAVRRPYIVQLADAPVASYSGGIAGLQATQPAPGQRLNLQSQPVQLYTNYLQQRQASVQAIVAGAPVLDTAKVTGKIVTCLRGVNNRVDKSLA